MRNDNDGHLYDIFPALQQLRGEGVSRDNAADAELKRRVAINAADPRAAALYADISGDDWAHLYPAAAQPQQPDTDSAIDIFLDTYGAGEPGEAALLEKLIFNPVPPDYSQVLAADDPAPATDNLDTLIADLTTSTSTETPEPSENAENSEASETIPAAHRRREPARSSSLSESLAKSYIRQGRYERAYEIISELNLNNPEKSVYFADQLRFLQKLIAIKRSRTDAPPSAH